MLVEVRALIDRFHVIIRKKAGADLDLWIAAARPSFIASFANGIGKGTAAVHAADKQPWSNGQVEGQFTKFTRKWSVMTRPAFDQVGACGTRKDQSD